MAKIRHVAFMIKQPAVAKEFYEKAFGFEECYASASGAYMVTDGTYNVALLPIRAGQSEAAGTHRADGGEVNQAPGINHFGFVVDNVDESVDRLGQELRHGQNPQDGRPAEMRVFDPWGQGFDLSARGYFGREEVRLPAVRRIVLQAEDPEEVAQFYATKLDLSVVGRGEDGSVVLGDGLISMAVVPDGPADKQGIQTIGIQVDDWDATAERFRAMGQELPRPTHPEGEVTILDPEGNQLILSQTGWKA